MYFFFLKKDLELCLVLKKKKKKKRSFCSFIEHPCHVSVLWKSSTLSVESMARSRREIERAGFKTLPYADYRTHPCRTPIVSLLPGIQPWPSPPGPSASPWAEMGFSFSSVGSVLSFLCQRTQLLCQNCFLLWDHSLLIPKNASPLHFCSKLFCYQSHSKQILDKGARELGVLGGPRNP